MAACHPIRVVFRGNCPCVREGPCRTPVTPRRRLTSGGGMRRASGTGLRVSQVSFAPEKRRTCTRPLSGGRTPRGPLRAASPCLRHLPSEAALLRRIGLQGKPRGAVRGCGASSRAGWLGGIPPAPPARESACPRARLSRPPLTPRASSCGRLRAEGRRCAVRGHIPSRHVPVVRRDRPPARVLPTGSPTVGLGGG